MKCLKLDVQFLLANFEVELQSLGEYVAILKKMISQATLLAPKAPLELMVP